MNSVKGGTIMGFGHDSGGHFAVIDNGTTCEKVYYCTEDHSAFD